MGLSLLTSMPVPSKQKPFVGPLLLAPMEGVMDWILRDLLTSIGGIDHTVTEFIRVTSYLHTYKIFMRYCPELKTQGRTRSGVPVFIQLLGGHSEPLAANAKRAADLGALGIDLNFGCPAKTVNRHDGGAAILKSCHRLYDITKAVRESVPEQLPVTAKMRLGFETPEPCIENALALASAGVSGLTIHCRTKVQGYRPCADWNWFVKIKNSLEANGYSHVSLVVNGDIFDTLSFQKCRDLTGADYFMMGRGFFANPYLGQQMKDFLLQQKHPSQITYQQIQPLIPGYFQNCYEAVNGYFAVSRTKQWLKILSTQHEDFKVLFEKLKKIQKPEDFRSQLWHSLS